jgi:DNA-binding NarL/FixJ family response regulator
MSIHVLLADDHPMVRQSLRAVLEGQGFQIVGEAANGHEAVKIAEQVRPDVAVLDVSMPGLNGLDAADQIRKVSPRTKNVLITMYEDERFILRAVHLGVQGFLLKSRAAAMDLVQAIREVCRGAVFLCPEASKVVVNAYLKDQHPEPDPLTAREREVLQLIAEGYTTKELATRLNISLHTAESYRTKVMEKLNIHCTAGLVRYAIRRGLTTV